MLLRHFWLSARRAVAAATVGFIALLPALTACGQAFPQPAQELNVKITGAAQRLEMVVNSSRILDMPFRVPRVLVQNPELLRATPISPTKVQISAKKPGVTQLNLWDMDGEVHTVNVVVTGDARELQLLLERLFPEASVKVRPLSNSAVLTGYVPSADMVNRVMGIAEDFYPKVINNIEVGGAQTVLLHVKVYEVSRTKLRRYGIDWATFNPNINFVQKVGGNITQSTISGGGAATAAGETMAIGLVNGASSFFGFMDMLRQHNLVKTLAEPTLVTVSGRPASFHSGGEFPVPVPQSLGTLSIEYRLFGTRVDFVPIVRSNGSLRLEVRPQVSEIDPTRSVTINQVTVPGLRSRWVDTAVEMQAGQTLALAGLIQTRVEAENRMVPVLGELPWVGGAFRKVSETTNEIELLILVTPEFVDAMDKHEVPPCLPGTNTTSPSDVELYGRGYVEVPKCNCPPGSESSMQIQGAVEGSPPASINPAHGTITPGLQAPEGPVSAAPPMDLAPPVQTAPTFDPSSLAPPNINSPAATSAPADGLTPPTLDPGFPLGSIYPESIQRAGATAPLGARTAMQNPHVAAQCEWGFPGFAKEVGSAILRTRWL